MHRAGMAAVVLMALGLCACENTGPDSAARLPPTDPSVLARIQQGGKLVVGVEFDQPGMSEKDPVTGRLTGFDVEIANLIAAQLGVKETDVEFKEIGSSNHEAFLTLGAVDLVVAAYPITDARRAVVGQAGPYLVTGQELLVRQDESAITGPDAVKGKKVCAPSGSAALKTVQRKYGAKPAPAAGVTACVTQLLNQAVDAVTADGAILLGYASQRPGRLRVVGPPFSTVRYGIGFPRGDSKTCAALRQALVQIFANGDWARAFRNTLGRAGVRTPTKPVVDPTC
jgi:glutamate transport system substrate-binding protein